MRVLLLAEIDPTVPYPYESGYSWNAGNNVFATAVATYFAARGGRFMSVPNAKASLSADPDWARKNFDCVVFPEACILADEYVDLMQDRVKMIARIGIPVYALGAGVQAKFGCGVAFVDTIRETAQPYLDAIYRSGGFMTVRGELTQSVCKKLGYDCTVTGCTSLFLHGRGFRVPTERVPRERFSVVLNGPAPEDVDAHVYQENPDAVYVDQDLLQHVLYDPENVTDDDLDHLVSARTVQLYRASLAGTPRLVMHEDFPDWVGALRRIGPSFSYGSRMHGNALALLSGIPCFIRVRDERVHEMVDFYRLPNSTVTPFDERKDSLYDLYRSLDWEPFHRAYDANYETFERILDSIAPVCGRVPEDFPPYPFEGRRQPSFTPDVLARLERALRRQRLHRGHFALLDALTFGLLHVRFGAKYARYF